MDRKKQTTIPTIYNMSSSKAREVVWAIEELADAGIEYKIVNLPRRERTKTMEVLKSHFPLGKSPTVKLENVDGSPEVTYQLFPNVLTEARLILQFFSDHYTNDEWIPDSPEDKSRDVFFQEFANSSLLAKIDGTVLFEVIPGLLYFPFKQLTLLMVLPIRMYFKNDINACCKIMEDALSEERPWFAGEKIGLADFNMSFPMDMAVHRKYIDLKEYPKLGKWYETVTSRPAYKRALEKGGPHDYQNFA